MMCGLLARRSASETTPAQRNALLHWREKGEDSWFYFLLTCNRNRCDNGVAAKTTTTTTTTTTKTTVSGATSSALLDNQAGSASLSMQSASVTIATTKETTVTNADEAAADDSDDDKVRISHRFNCFATFHFKVSLSFHWSPWKKMWPRSWTTFIRKPKMASHPWCKQSKKPTF